MDTISIAIGDARSSTCIVLPRGHDLVRQLESLLPSSSASPEPTVPFRYPQSEAPRPSYPSSSIPPRAPRVSMPPRRSMTMPMHAPMHHAPVHHTSLHTQSLSPGQARPPASTLPPNQQPHRSAALIQSLLHRPSPPPTATAPPLVSSAPRATYRRGRVGSGVTNGTKRCQIPGCGKISVSRGVCRGHGGGRRCQFEGCTKSAQSRGDYCWSHGGGHRCEVPGCMRSRKSKRFCKNHLNWGSANPIAREMAPRPVLLPRAEPVPAVVSSPPASSAGRLPSLHQALQTQHTMVYGTVSPTATSMGRPSFPTMMTSSISC